MINDKKLEKWSNFWVLSDENYPFKIYLSTYHQIPYKNIVIYATSNSEISVNWIPSALSYLKFHHNILTYRFKKLSDEKKCSK